VITTRKKCTTCMAGESRSVDSSEQAGKHVDVTMVINEGNKYSLRNFSFGA